MPNRTVHCSVCNRAITGYDFPKRMEKLRRHYKNSHPAKFKKWHKR